MKTAQNWWLPAVCTVMQACTMVTVQSGDVVRTSHSFGLGEISLAATDRPVVITTKGVGVTVGANHAALGYLKEQLIFFPDSTKCRLLVIAKDGGDAFRILELLKSNNVSFNAGCIAKGE